MISPLRLTLSQEWGGGDPLTSVALAPLEEPLQLPL